MISFELDEDQLALQSVLKDFAAHEIRPLARQCDEDRAVPAGLLHRIAALGVTTPTASAPGGDDEIDALGSVVAAEELAYGDPGISYEAFGSGHAALLLSAAGSPEQQAHYLPVLSRGGRGSVLYYEGWGRRASELEATAALVHGQWVINGEKFFVSNAGDAEVSLAVARDIETGELRAFLFEGTPPGYVLGNDDRELPNSGLRAAHTGAVAIRHIRLEETAVLPGAGAELARALGRMRLTAPALALGAARAAKDYAAKYALERIAFGKPISAFQAVAFLLADCDTAVDGARLSLWQAASRLELLPDSGTIDELVSGVVTRICTGMERVVRDCLQVLGGSGFIKDHPVELWWRDVVTLASIDVDPLLSSVTLDG
jgi:hypothetical protein